MINNIKNNTYNGNRYENTSLNIKISEIPTNLPQEDRTKNTLFNKYNKIESKANMELVEKIQKEIGKAELIAIKIVRGEEITHEELQFISKKYPELKETAEKSVKENNNLKEVFKSYKTEKQIEEVISKLIKNIIHNENLGLLSKSQGKIKLSSVEELQKYAKELSKEFEKVEKIAIKIIRCEKLTKEESEFITEEYPEIKKFAKKSINENIRLKENLRNYNTELKRQEVLSEAINELKDKGEKGFLSKIEVKIKMEGMLGIKKSLQKEVIQLKKAVLVAVKLIKLGKLTTSENKFISEKHPEIKKFAQEILMEYENLKEEIKNCSRDERRQEILYKKIRHIENIDKNDILSEIQDVLKKEVIEKIKLYEQNKYKENDLKFYLYPYWYLLCNSAWPKIGLITIVLVAGILYIIN